MDNAFPVSVSGGVEDSRLNYYGNPRAEVLQFLTWVPQKVIDIGCGSGATGKILQERFPECQLFGIERNQVVAAHAAARYKVVLVGDVEAMELSASDVPFSEIDTVLLLDILEHLYNPWHFLSKLRGLLSKNCRLVASIPNVFNIQLLDELAAGNWTYTADGLLDITHIRFFTESGMRLLFKEAGYHVCSVNDLPHPVMRLPEPIYQGPDHLETHNILVKNMSAERLSDLYAIQKVIIAACDAEIAPDVLPVKQTLHPPVQSPVSPTQRLREAYLDVVRRSLLGLISEDASMLPSGGEAPFNADKREAGLDWPSSAYSMIGNKRMLNIQHLAEQVLANHTPGDFIEAGVWRGGACIMFRAVLNAYSVSDRVVWVADSFEGLPEPSPQLYPADAGDNHHKYEALAVPMEQVQRNFQKYGLLDDQVKFIKGWFRDTLPEVSVTQLAILRLDGDMYESTMDALVNLFPKVSHGGYVIVDDYGYAENCRAAVDEFRAKHGIRDPIQEIDQFGIYWQNILPNSFSGTPIAENPAGNGTSAPSIDNDAGIVMTDNAFPQEGSSENNADAEALENSHQNGNYGYCYCCSKWVFFRIVGPWLRDHYVCSECGSLPRYRHLMYVLDSFFPQWHVSHIHEMDPCHDYISSGSSNYGYSVLDTTGEGEESSEVYKYENLENLSFPDETFDLFITQDILKHVFSPSKAMQEIMRVLKPGGAHVFTLPRYNQLESSYACASRTESGAVRHFCDAEYHGPKTADHKWLVKWKFGRDLERLITRWCDNSTTTCLTRDRTLGLDGEFLEVFVVKKRHRI